MKGLLGLVWSSFVKFVNRLVGLVLAYGRLAFLSIAVSILVPSGMHRYLGLSHDVTTIIMKVLLTITPIFPTAIYAKLKEEDCSNEDYSMDLCFVAWIITIVFAWWM